MSKEIEFLKEIEEDVTNSTNGGALIINLANIIRKLGSRISDVEYEESEKARMKTDWVMAVDNNPAQKDLVLVKVTDHDIIMPAIYYKSLGGFYHYSLFYHQGGQNTVYKKTQLNDIGKNEIENVVEWKHIAE